MKIQRSVTFAITLAGASMLGMAPADVQAQDINEAVPMAFKEMNGRNWEKAQSILAKVVDVYAERAKQLYGGKFGVIYYNKGYCELKIGGKLKAAGGPENLDKANKYYEMAKQSFANCYKFPSDDKGKNTYHKKSLYYWGQSAQAMGEYKEAITQYKKFLDEREEGRDEYDKGIMALSLAICHFKLEKPDMKQGIQYFETALNNKDQWNTPDEAIVTAFQALTEAVIKTKNEQALIDFLNQNRAAITLRPFEMVKFTPFFQKLAVEAMEEDMMYAAFNLFALIPGTKVSISELELLKSELALYPRDGIKDGPHVIAKADIDKNLTKLRTEDRAGDPHEVLALSALAFTHESKGNVRGAFAAYEQLELYFNKSKKREENLYNLVRTSARIGEVMLTEQYGSEFLKSYPGSKHESQVRSFMLSSLFASGEYEKCEEVAGAMIGQLAKPSKQHDLCLHVLGGSKFYLGKFVDCHQLLLDHVKMYPKSEYKIAAEFFVASNLSRLQDWKQAALKLDEFLKKYPDPAKNVYIPFALYDRANVHYSEGENEQALVLLNRIEKEFKGTSIEEMAYNLKGNIMQSDGDREGALTYYNKALTLAEHKGNGIVASESLNYLVGLLGVEKIGKEPNPNLKDALPFYDKFWKEYPDSPYKAQVAVSGMPAMKEAGRSDEALAKLQAVIAEMAKKENPAGLDAAIGSYTKAYLESGKTADQLKDHYYKFPGVDFNDTRTLAMLRIAIIGVFEDNLKKAEAAKDQAAINLSQSRIKVLFNDLKADYPVEKLSNFVLVRVGDYLRKKTDNPRQSLAYYDERLKRPQVNGRINAQFGKADILGQSSNAGERKQAVTILNEVIEAANEEGGADRKIRDEALYRIIEINNTEKDWKALAENAEKYKKEYSSEKARVMFLLAQAYESMSNVEKAIKAYTEVYIANMANIAISAPAISRSTELMWEKGDKQKAYEAAARFINSSEESFNKIKDDLDDEVAEKWLEIQTRVKTWEAGGEIKTLEEIKKEREGR
ncbi:Tetratricopeptide repeat-containing protein [Rubritalea squalenifaciens DSM 18772]|uniref:Tetratricopeptide repeat-containing protein n=1 Tax=Rubritalea squalenifaciens DSM 18772 TaxID=1123071 RepID=A0A1M6DKP0_9BACT|nr:tetratricopeptide repeat protein [Rubritalea squalenifaciens]SHI73884.1 Tetratricopeptide repeat-containing protein [Rubritalea squalenifaciens DSM 18772]